MSDTQSSEELQIRVEQKMEAKLRDLLDKAKNITPFYDDDTLMLIYKDCFNTDHVFLNKLEIIAKNHKNAQEEEDRDWIQFKQQQKAVVKVSSSGAHTENRERFYFLEDKELLQRAKYFDPERQRAHWQQRKEDIRQRQEQKFKSNHQNKPKFQEKVQNQQAAQLQKKMKFKEKVEDANASDIKNQTLLQTNAKTASKYTEKKQKYAEKKADKLQQTVLDNNNKQENGTKKEVKQHQKTKYQEKAPKTQSAAESQQPKIQAKQQQNNHSRQQPKSIVTQSVQQKVIQPPKKIVAHIQIDPEVRRTFDQSCRLNSFILKFIPPTSKLQKISYIRDPNGTYREVKTRQPLLK